MKKLKLKTVIIPILIVCAVIGGVSYVTIKNRIKKENALKIVQLNKQKADEKKVNDKRVADAKAITDAKAKAIEDAKVEVTKPVNNPMYIVKEEVVYGRMHEMINTKIKAGDDLIYGEISITAQNCEEMIANITASNYPDKNELLGFLANWKKGRFKAAVAEHNYLWGKLGGTIGKAVSLR